MITAMGQEFCRKQQHVVIVTGLSGSGKSTAIKAFEDLGYFCIDNLPVPLLPSLLELCEKKMPEITRIALGIDIRERSFLEEYGAIFSDLEGKGYFLEIVFLEADRDVLRRRYSQTRRVHPLEYGEETEGKSLIDAIDLERKLLKPLRDRADRVIDTSDFTVHDLKSLIVRSYRIVSEKELLKVQVMSFGYKYGVPVEADVVMDVRFLPNPYFVDDLKDLTGRTALVKEWVMKHEDFKAFMSTVSDLFDFLLPRYIREGKRYLTIAFGCTGGRHRSVVVAEEFVRWLKTRGFPAIIFHRDVEHG